MSAPWSIALAYAVGCISFASLAAHLRGVDIRASGSGNPGATNVSRVLGRNWGIAVLALDVAKGLVPVLFLSAPLSELGLSGNVPLLVDPQGKVLILFFAVLGHVYPVNTGFRGGKGVATLLGGTLALSPVLALIAVLTHLILKRLLGFVSVASVGLGWSLPVSQLVGRAAGWSGHALDGTLVLVALALLITVRHRDNFRRIRAGTEDRYDDPDNDEPNDDTAAGML